MAFSPFSKPRQSMCKSTRVPSAIGNFTSILMVGLHVTLLISPSGNQLNHVCTVVSFKFLKVSRTIAILLRLTPSAPGACCIARNMISMQHPTLLPLPTGPITHRT